MKDMRFKSFMTWVGYSVPLKILVEGQGSFYYDTYDETTMKIPEWNKWYVYSFWPKALIRDGEVKLGIMVKIGKEKFR